MPSPLLRLNYFLGRFRGIPFRWVNLGQKNRKRRAPTRASPPPPDMASGLPSSGEVGSQDHPCEERVRGAEGARDAGRPQAQPAAAGRRRHTSGIPGLPTPAPVAGASAPSLPPARPRWKRNYAVRLWFSRDMVEGVTRGRAVGGTSGPQSGQMFPGRLPATYLTSRVGDAARGRNRTGPEPGRAAVRNPRGSVLLAWTNAGRDREGVVTEE